MTITFEAIDTMLREAGVACTPLQGAIQFSRPTQTYRSPAGAPHVDVVLKLFDEDVLIVAPVAFLASGPHVDATIRACMMLQYRSGLVRLDFDERDGEIRAVIAFPVADSTLTVAQVTRCVDEMVATVDAWYPTIS